jgi:hypothetical protein
MVRSGGAPLSVRNARPGRVAGPFVETEGAIVDRASKERTYSAARTFDACCPFGPVVTSKLTR